MFKINITRECHFASASVVFDVGRASAIVDFGLRCTLDKLLIFQKGYFSQETEANSLDFIHINQPAVGEFANRRQQINI